MVPATRISVSGRCRGAPADREHAGDYDRAGREQPGHRWRHRAGREQHDHRGEHQGRLSRTGAEWHRLPSDQLGLVDHEHVGIVEVLVERAPAALQQERVTDGQRRLAGELLPLTLHREHDQIATLGHHSRVRGLADEG